MEEEHQKALDALRAELPDLEKVKADVEVHKWMLLSYYQEEKSSTFILRNNVD